MKSIRVEKAARRLTVCEHGQILLRCRVALGRQPAGRKQAEGDVKTPEGVYFICLKRDTGKFGPALGISFPSAADARLALAEGRIDADTAAAIERAEALRVRPPWGTALGGEIYLHGGAAGDWTAGCIALENENMAKLFALCHEGDEVVITA